MTPAEGSVVDMRGVSVIRSGNLLLDGVDWRIGPGERWVLLGPNGSGKTTLISVASTYLWPSRGDVTVLGRAVGTVDIRELRKSVGIVSAALEARIPNQISALDVVVAGATGAIAPWWDRHSPRAQKKAREMLALVETYVPHTGSFLLLDEPAAGLDLGAREQLAALLSRLNDDPHLAAIVVVTHHVEEIAPGTTHALVLRGGRVVASGTAGTTVTGPVLSEAFGLELVVRRVGRRFTARAASAL